MVGHDDRQRYEMRNDMRLGGWHETVSVDELRCGALCQFRGTLSSDNLSGGQTTGYATAELRETGSIMQFGSSGAQLRSGVRSA